MMYNPLNRCRAILLPITITAAAATAAFASPEWALRGEVIGYERDPLPHESMEYPRPRPAEPLYFNWRQIDRARERVETTDWGRSFLNSLMSVRNRFVMTVSEEDIERYIDERVNFFLPRDPIVRTNTSYMPHHWEWSASEPDTYRSRVSDFEWPNEDYPLEHVQKIMSPRGRIIEYRYWEDEDGIRYYFEQFLQKQVIGALIWDFKRMGMAYLLTGEDDFADRTAFLLYRLSQVYPHWIPHGPGETYGVMGPDGYEELFFSPNPPFPYVCGRIREWYIGDSALLHNTAAAYDMIYDSGALERLSERVGEDVRIRIERDLLYEIAAFSKEFMPDMHNPNGVNTRAFATLGLVMQDPDMIRIAMDQFDPILHSGTNLDGFWHEGTYSYHRMVIMGMIDFPEIFANYRDPDGYVDDQGRRFDHVDIYQAYPELRNFYSIPRHLFLPNNYVHPFNDSSIHMDSSQTRQIDEQTFVNYGGYYVPPRATDYSVFFRPDQSIHEGREMEQPEWRSLLHPASGFAFLRSLKGDNAAEVFFEYSEFSGHHHRDLLHLTIFAKGYDLSPDLGYTYTRDRPFADSTASHNTVIVNARGQDLEHGELNAAVLATTGDETRSAVQYISARAEAAYKPEGVSVYDRELALVPVGEDDFYLFDLFRVRGGETHDWLFHGAADYPQEVAADFEFRPIEGDFLEYSGGGVPTESMEAGHDYFRRTHADRDEVAEAMEIIRQESGMDFITDIERAANETDSLSYEFRFVGDVEPPYWGRSWSAVPPFQPDFALPLQEDVALQTRLFSGSPLGFYRATAPGIRRAQERDDLLADARMPIIVARRSQPTGTTHFAAIHQPYAGSPFVEAVERLHLDETTETAAFAVTHGGGTDVLLSSRSPEGRVRVEHGGLNFELEGRFGMVRLNDGTVGDALLVEGTRLVAGDWSLHSPRANLAGELVDWVDGYTSREGVLMVDLDSGGYHLPPGTLLRIDHGHGVRVALPLREIDRRGEAERIRLKDVFRLHSGRGEVAEVIPGQGIRSTIQQARAFYGEGFAGQRLLLGDREFTISHTHIGWEIDVAETEGLSDVSVGDSFEIVPFRVGDSVSIPLHLRARLGDDGIYTVSGNIREDFDHHRKGLP